jgi:DNA-binding NtrC family response regulator
MEKSRILIADDDYIFCELTKYILTENNFDVVLANNSDTAIKYIKENPCDLILLDLHFPDYQTGISSLESLHTSNKDIPIIIITSDNLGLVNRFPDLVRKGAYDVIEKPIQEERLILTLKNALNHYSLKNKKALHPKAEFLYLLGNSNLIRKVREKVENQLNTENNLIIYGDKGTGIKNIINKLHENSSRSTKKIYTIECSKLNNKDMEIELFGHPTERNYEKKFRELKIIQAEKSFFVINDLHLMPLKTQEKLARTLLGRKLKNLGGRSLENIDVKLILTTNKKNYSKPFSPNLCPLLVNLCEDELILPSLEERVEDIPLLVKHLINSYNQTTDLHVTIQPSALKNLVNHKWKNNVTELQKVMLRILHEIDSNEITNKDIIFNEESVEYFIPLTFKEAIRNYEKIYLEQIMNYHDWSLNDAAKTLNIDRSNLFKKLQRHGIKIRKKR